jgi:hypothetical protein
MKTPKNAKWIKADKGEGLSIVYLDKEGNEMVRRKDPTKGSLKGSKAWRHNNPGNLVMGPHARQYGAIGSATYTELDENGKEKKFTFAIFPSYEAGKTAQIELIRGPKYATLTLHELPRKYTGVEEGKPDTKEAIAYRKFLEKATKLDMNRTIQSLNTDEFNTLIKKMENYEGWHPWEDGESYHPIQKITGVKMCRHRITDFLVLDYEEKHWISRERAIFLAEQKKLRAVVVHNKKNSVLKAISK